MAERKRTSTRSRRRRKPNSAAGGNPNSYKHLYQGGASQAQPDVDEVASSAATLGKGSDSVDWKSDYGYVIRDLRTLFIVSILIFAVMIGAGFLV